MNILYTFIYTHIYIYIDIHIQMHRKSMLYYTSLVYFNYFILFIYFFNLIFGVTGSQNHTSFNIQLNITLFAHCIVCPLTKAKSLSIFLQLFPPSAPSITSLLSMSMIRCNIHEYVCI